MVSAVGEWLHMQALRPVEHQSVLPVNPSANEQRVPSACEEEITTQFIEPRPRQHKDGAG